MSNKLFVGGLSWDTTDQSLRDFFSKLGTVVSASVIMDKFSGKSKGFAFVEMATEKDAQEVVRKCKGVELDGNKLTVSLARPKTETKDAGGAGFKKRRAV